MTPVGAPHYPKDTCHWQRNRQTMGLKEQLWTSDTHLTCSVETAFLWHVFFFFVETVRSSSVLLAALKMLQIYTTTITRRCSHDCNHTWQVFLNHLLTFLFLKCNSNDSKRNPVVCDARVTLTLLPCSKHLYRTTAEANEFGCVC